MKKNKFIISSEKTSTSSAKQIGGGSSMKFRIINDEVGDNDKIYESNGN